MPPSRRPHLYLCVVHDVPKSVVLGYAYSYEGHKVSKIVFYFAHRPSDQLDQQITDKGNEYLGLTGIGSGSYERFYLQVLLDQFKERFYQPAPFVKLGNG